MNGLSLAVTLLRACPSKLASVVETRLVLQALCDLCWARWAERYLDEARTDITFKKSPVSRIRGNKGLSMAAQRVGNQTMYIVPEKMPGGDYL
ncbi:hypothetical protein F4859DRAFT_484284 [Xylaria cf. heliscus]|nr:hypothetical protein F4859DRAFT_484284 [Xylaria cf. heliscus]